MLATLSLLASVTEGLGIGLLIPLLDQMLGGSVSVPAGPLAEIMQRTGAWIQGHWQVFGLAAAILLLIALRTVLVVASVAVGARFIASITYRLRVDLASQILRVDYKFFSSCEQGRLFNTLEAQTYRMGEALNYLINLIGAAVAVTATFVLLLMLSWQLTILVCLLVLPVSVFVWRLTKRGRHLGHALVDAYAVLSGRLIELLIAMRTIRLFGQETREKDRIAAAAAQVRRVFAKAELLTGSMPAVLELLYMPVFVGVLAYANYRGIGVPSLLAFIALLYRMQPQLRILDQARVSLGTYASGIEQVHSLLREDDKPYPGSGTLQFDGLHTAVEFRNVSLTHANSDVPAVREASFRIEMGSIVALAGPSGSGKSTIIALLYRLYAPDTGSIIVDGTPLSELDLASWRSRLAFAGQDSELLQGTVWENISYGASQANESEIIAAATLANADEFIRALPEGYQTEIDPRGTNLSGGQRQRLALARALVRKPDILILDEATNALDAVTETTIQQTIERLAGVCTILIVTHRLSTVRNANQLIVIEGGRIVDHGTPRDLMNRRPISDLQEMY